MTTRVYFTKKARTNIYHAGKMVKKIHENGKNKGQEYTKCDRTQPANKGDKIFIKKGESYYWWQFAFGPKIYSKEQPRRSWLTRSDFLSWLYDMEDVEIGLATASCQSDLETLVEEWTSEIESQKEELEGRLDNMPEQLRDSDSGTTLQERIDGLDSWVQDLEQVDLTVDEDELRETAKEELNSGIPAGKEDEYEEFTEEDIEDKFQELLQEKVDEILDELKNCSSNL